MLKSSFGIRRRNSRHRKSHAQHPASDAPGLAKLRHILIVLPDLSGGGAERLHVILATHWRRQGIQVTFALMEHRGELLELLPEGVDVVDLKARRIRNAVIPLANLLRETCPDIVLAAMWPLTTVASLSWLLAGRPGRLFLSDHSHVSVSCAEELGVPPRLAGAIMRASYAPAAGVIAVSQAVKRDLRGMSGLPESAIRVIYNAAAVGVSASREPPEIAARLWGEGFDYHILSVGKLKTEKDHATLIRAFALLPKSLNAKLTIVGDGPLRSQLEQLVSELGLARTVSLPGFSLDPYPWFRSADLFVLSSTREGFGNVLVEALECGVPVVSTDCLGGTAEVLAGGRFGRLVPSRDPAALAAAMQEFLSKPHDREALIARSKAFSADVIAGEYLDYFVERC